MPSPRVCDKRRRRSTLGLAILAVATLLCPGCSPLEPFEIDRSLPRERVTIASSTGPGFWKREGLPKLRGTGLRKLAVVEFRVDFVTRRMNPAGEEETIDYGRDTMEAISEQMLTDFMNHLSAFGLEIVPLSSITRSKAYGEYVIEDEPDTEPNRLGDNGLGRTLAAELRTSQNLVWTAVASRDPTIRRTASSAARLTGSPPGGACGSRSPSSQSPSIPPGATAGGTARSSRRPEA